MFEPLWRVRGGLGEWLGTDVRGGAADRETRGTRRKIVRRGFVSRGVVCARGQQTRMDARMVFALLKTRSRGAKDEVVWCEIRAYHCRQPALKTRSTEAKFALKKRNRSDAARTAGREAAQVLMTLVNGRTWGTTECEETFS